MRKISTVVALLSASFALTACTNKDAAKAPEAAAPAMETAAPAADTGAAMDSTVPAADAGTASPTETSGTGLDSGDDTKK
jgi:hypothetical protein